MADTTFFDLADRNILCNTAYPFRKELFRKYSSNEDLFSDEHALSFYIHVPFCARLCSFCEYTRFLAGDPAAESRYLDLLEEQIRSFLDTHRVDLTYGLDIGGGTPTALGEAHFARLLSLASLLEAAPKASDYEKSIEISFSTITEQKLESIADAGFKRISAGFQSGDRRLIRSQDRIYTELRRIGDVIERAHRFGIPRINLDLMYGLSGQTDESIQETLDAVGQLLPDQVTLYETRFNKTKKIPPDVSRELQYRQYCTLHQGLSALGYSAPFGANAFSRGKDDGLSSYIRNRMFLCKPYKGFGISAQSMTRRGISYGVLKNTRALRLPALPRLSEGDNYLLPPEEIAAKYVSVALYGGCFSLAVLDEILGTDAAEYYREALGFLLERKYISLSGKTARLTRKGFRWYGAIAALFWSDDQKNALLNDR